MISDVYLDHSTYAEPPSRLGAFSVRPIFVLDLWLMCANSGKTSVVVQLVLPLPCIMFMYIWMVV